ncbi:MAG: hypothetical protein AAB426_00460 [Myxococcota bacterium]
MMRAQEMAALEMEVLVARAARQGRLVLSEVLDTYRCLAPAHHAQLSNDRRIDLPALVGALTWLPPQFLGTREVWLVPDLALFTHSPVDGGALPAGVLDGGTLLLEAVHGQSSIVELAAHLCALTLEHRKARALHAALDLAVTPELAAAAQLAFAWGVDEAALDAADTATAGALLRFLLRDEELAQVQVHAALSREQLDVRGADMGARLLATLAEMGLAGRPLHLWIGSPMVTDLLSPYARELRQVLVDWARENPAALGDDLTPLPVDVSEDQLYAVAADFLRTDGALMTERLAADRTVGILHYVIDQVPFEAIDLGRIEQRVADARLAPFDVEGGAPVLLRLTPDPKDPDAATLRVLLTALGPQVRSVTLALDGRVPGRRAGSMVLPTHVRRFEGGERLSLRGVVRMNVEALQAHTDATVASGELLSVQCPRLLPQSVEGVAAAAIESGGAGYLAAVLEALDAHGLGEDTAIECVVVASARAGTERPHVATLAAHAAFSLARLHELLPAPRPAVPERRPRDAGRGRATGARGVRIRA